MHTTAAATGDVPPVAETAGAPAVSVEPLGGHTAFCADPSPAADVALRHLAALGATVARPAGGEPGGTALYIGTPGSTGPVLGCDIDWSPADAPQIDDETAVQAATGLMTVHGRRRGEPARIPVDYASACAGVLAVHGVLASLIARERGTPVRRTGTSVTHAALLTVSQYLAAATADEEEFLPRDRPGDGPPFRSRDGVWFELEALDQRPWQHFWTELGAPEQDVRRGFQPFVLRYPKAVSPLPPTLARAAAEQDFDTLAKIAGATGMSICRIRTMAERRGDPDALSGGRVPGPWRFTPSGHPAALAPDPAVPPPPGLPLDGVTVVEAGRRIQAPMATLVLRLLGARVVRIEPLGGDPLRGMPPMTGDCSARFLALNKGKEVLHADLKSAAGREAVLGLVREADVFLHNWAPGKAAVFGLDSAHLHAVNPRLVYGYSSGWGDALGDSPPLGTDFMAQAYSGLADLMSGGGTPRPSLMTLVDVLGGLVAAEGLLAGLLHRERTGNGPRVDTSLLSASTVLQYEALERPPSRHAAGCGTAAVPALDGPWRTADGWLALSARTRTAAERLTRLLGLGPADGADLRPGAAARFAGRTTAEWTADLAAAGITATPVATDLRQLDRTPAGRTALTREECTLVTAPWRFDA
jgi:CoA:oxalate CoA-transferase